MAHRIGGSLARRGVQPSDRDDILQETAIRLYRSWDHVDPDRPVEPYARVIATNVWRDTIRRGPRDEPVETVPDRSSVPDAVERACIMRDELSRVRRAMDRLRPEQRRILHVLAAEELGAGEVASATPDALRMARMRARRDLRAVLKTASGFVAVMWAGLRRSGHASPIASVPTAFVVLTVLFTIPGPATTTEQGQDRPQSQPTAGAQPAGFRAPASGRMTAGRPRTVRPALAPTRVNRAAFKPPPKYYWVGAGGTKAGLVFEVAVGGRGVRIGDGGNGLPACLLGVDSATTRAASCQP
jgi:RNA polymerase sigma factor (sigma-70 family)